MSAPLIQLNNVSKSYGDTRVLSNVNLTVNEGEFVAIVGYSGTGKSTFINMISGLLKPDDGTVLMNGSSITGPGPERGLVFQNYSLLPWLTVAENIALAVDEVFPRWSAAERADHVAKYVAMFQRRLEKGQWHHAPSLGCREFAAKVEPAPEGLRPAEIVDRPLGWMFYDFDWPNYRGGEAPADAPVKPLFFEARLTGGVLLVPPRNDVRKAMETNP